ncbi:hypothetical protein [Streptomyces sp. NPDC001068]|uniref:hypothetical protein n=1 Tax=Streptomyces sp. NPDC001068 TaxID=3364544 RepID=UPI0036AFDEA1
MPTAAEQRLLSESRAFRIVHAFAGNDALGLFQMRQLREIGKHRSLRGVALQDIYGILRGRGVHHLPIELTRNQDDHIVVWKPGTPGTGLLDRVRALSEAAGSRTQATQLRDSDVCTLYRAALQEQQRIRVASL